MPGAGGRAGAADLLASHLTSTSHFQECAPGRYALVDRRETPAGDPSMKEHEMQSEPIRYPAGADWVHRGDLPPLTLMRARLALAVCLLQTHECVSLSAAEPLIARLELGSGRTVTVRPELVRRQDGIGLRLTLDRVHHDDVAEVSRIHDRIVTS
jgi:hypothetical protein